MLPTPPSHCPQYFSGIVPPQTQTLKCSGHHHPKWFHDRFRDGQFCGSCEREAFFFLLSEKISSRRPLSFQIQSSQGREEEIVLMPWGSLLHSRSLSEQFDFITQENPFLFKSLWVQFLSLTTKWILVNINSNCTCQRKNKVFPTFTPKTC